MQVTDYMSTLNATKFVSNGWLLVPAAAKSLQSSLTLCDPIECSPPGCPIPGILQARTLEWVAISFSNAWKWKVKSESEVAQSRPHGLQPTRLLCPRDFPGKSTGVGCHCLLLEWTVFISFSLSPNLEFLTHNRWNAFLSPIKDPPWLFKISSTETDSHMKS